MKFLDFMLFVILAVIIGGFLYFANVEFGVLFGISVGDILIVSALLTAITVIRDVERNRS